MAKAISTWLSDLFIFLIRLFVFVVFGNPLSVFILHLLAPQKAVEFVKDGTLFGNTIRKFYERQALKWPFRWSRWWMNIENITRYSDEQQIEYFFEVAIKNNTAADTLKAMYKGHQSEDFWPEACKELFFKYGDRKMPATEDRWHKSNPDDVITVMEFMIHNMRLNGSALMKVIRHAAVSDFWRDELKRYLFSGKLNDMNFELLIDAVTTDCHSGDLQILGVLLEYIKRYGISEEHMCRIRSQYPQPFVELVTQEATIYWQSKEVKSFKNTNEGRNAWRKFCKKTKIVPEAQRLMTKEQYRIFHDAGRKLDKEAISYILSYNSDATLKNLVLEFEYDSEVVQKIQKVMADGAKALQKKTNKNKKKS